MATSGQTIITRTRDQIIAAAMRKVQALAKGQVPDTEDYTNASIALNDLIAQYQTHGMQLWKRVSYVLPLVANQDTYTIGVGQTNNTPFPLKLHQGISRNTSSNTQIDLNIISVYDFNLLPRTEPPSGPPVNATYQPFRNYGELRIWPKPNAATAAQNELTLIFQAPFEGFVSSTDEADFPSEWNLPITYGLAVLLAPEFGVPLQDRQVLRDEHKEYLDTAKSFGNEEASIFFQVNRR